MARNDDAAEELVSSQENAPGILRMSSDMHSPTRTHRTSSVAWTCLSDYLSLCFVGNYIFWALYFKRS